MNQIVGLFLMISWIPKINYLTSCVYSRFFLLKVVLRSWQNLCGAWSGQCKAPTSNVYLKTRFKSSSSLLKVESNQEPERHKHSTPHWNDFLPKANGLWPLNQSSYIMVVWKSRIFIWVSFKIIFFCFPFFTSSALLVLVLLF